MIFFWSLKRGHYIPCSVEHLTFELAGSAANQVDPEWMKQAAAGVLHYFKDELGQSHVTVAEFTTALSKVFQGLGMTAEVTTIAPGSGTRGCAGSASSGLARRSAGHRGRVGRTGRIGLSKSLTLTVDHGPRIQLSDRRILWPARLRQNDHRTQTLVPRVPKVVGLDRGPAAFLDERKSRAPPRITGSPLKTVTPRP